MPSGGTISSPSGLATPLATLARRCGHPDGDGQPHPLADLAPQPHGDLGGRARDAPEPADVQERLVDRESLDQRRRLRKTSNTALLALAYTPIRGGTTTAGHSRRACTPPMAVRTPCALAS